MILRKELLFIFALLIFVSSDAFSRSFRVNQIPNGSKFGCANCHASAGGGGSLNAFGQAVGSGFLNGDNVDWKKALADLDSDGDGFTNGEELQDANADWNIGMADPGDLDKVANPGDPESKPEPNSVEEYDFAVSLNAFPNPFSEKINLEMDISNNVQLNVRIYSMSGVLVSTLYNGQAVAGTMELGWDAATAPAGAYLVMIDSEQFSRIIFINKI